MQPYLEISTNISLKPQSIQIHKQFTKRKGSVKAESIKNLDRKGKAYNGYMSDATARQVKKMIENWLLSIEIKQGGKIKYKNRSSVYPTFVTVTLPFKQLHSDNHIKRVCLEPLIQWLTSEKLNAKGENIGWGVKCYFWRAEAQKNGNIHFHIIVDKWIDMSRLQTKWNQIIDRLGYVKMYQSKMKYIYKAGFVIRQEQLKKQVETLRKKLKKQGVSLTLAGARKECIDAQKKSYEAGKLNDFTNPPSTNIHKLGGIKSITAYVTKYVTKKPQCLNAPADNQLVDGDYIYDVIEGVEGSERLQNERKYVPIYDSRMVQGRIWGRSDDLFNAKPESLTITAQTTFVDFDGSQPDGKKWSRAEFTHDEEILVYAEIIGKQIDKAEIDKINSRIDSDYIYIIPLRNKQLDYLNQISPTLKTRYVNHYLTLYDKLYLNAA